MMDACSRKPGHIEILMRLTAQARLGGVGASSKITTYVNQIPALEPRMTGERPFSIKGACCSEGTGHSHGRWSEHMHTMLFQPPPSSIRLVRSTPPRGPPLPAWSASDAGVGLEGCARWGTILLGITCRRQS
ncbi:hypothetical protein C8Q70DRAFT_66461 [Cubamyces menziesii]|nr:hypothetical protein C8Q70DRAFT_66461 [Cubamyces menziesii]